MNTITTMNLLNSVATFACLYDFADKRKEFFHVTAGSARAGGIEI